MNEHTYPGLHYPECYLLHLGYKEFFQRYPDLCNGTYTAMADPKHEVRGTGAMAFDKMKLTKVRLCGDRLKSEGN